MAEDLDLDRIISDPAYRRRVIARLNGASAECPTELDARGDRPVAQPAEQRPLD